MLSSVNRIGYGAMQLPGPGVWGPPRDPDAARALLRRAITLGVDHIDTAQYYGPDVANVLIREALHPYSEDLRIVTKVGWDRAPDGAWIPAGRPEQLRYAVHANLRSLQLERLAVVNLRLGGEGTGLPDAGVSLEEQLGALIELRDEGKIGAIGLSSACVDDLERGGTLIDIACVQNRFGLLDREHGPELDWCAERGIPFVPFFPLGSAFSQWSALEHPSVRDVAERHAATPAQVVLAWLLQLASHILLIPGTSTLAHLEENMAAGDLRLDDAGIETLNSLA